MACTSLALPAHAAPTCAINTGLDPACPLTSAGATISTETLNPAATTHTTDLLGTYSWGAGNQLSLSEPLYDHLHIDGVGDAYSVGDVALGYTRAFGGVKRLTQYAGLSASFPTGATTFSTGTTQLAPLYGLSYALGARVAVVASGEYTFSAGGTKQPFAPRVQAFTVAPRAIIDFSRTGVYAALGLQASSVRGDERYQTYQANGAFGFVHHHVNVSLTYAAPISSYARDHVFFGAVGLQASWQR